MRLKFGAVLAAALLASSGRADDQPTKPDDWRAAAGAEGLTPEEVERLVTSKVLIGVRGFNQVFAAYAEPKTAVFITSDSVLRAYVVLLEECLGRLERSRAGRLPAVLRPIWDGIPGAAPGTEYSIESVAAAKTRARVTVGVALRLLGAQTPGATAEETKLLDAEVARVEAASETTKPAWLGPPDPGFPALHYAQFRPRGNYVGDAVLEQYFRAAKWLQTIPFRASRSDEMLAAVVMLCGFRQSPDASAVGARDRRDRFVREFTAFLGEDGDPSIFSSRRDWRIRYETGFAAALADEVRAKRRERTGEPKSDVAEVTLHVLPAPTTPDASLLETTSGPDVGRLLPSGLDLAAGLGSTFARSHIQVPPSSKVFPLINGWHDVNLGRGDDLFRAYLRCLQALLDAPDPAAPDFMRSDAWAAKSVSSALSAWAGIRHAWTLNIRDSMKYLCAFDTPAGWVEPDPEFFWCLLELVRSTQAVLEDGGAFDPNLERACRLADLRNLVDLVAKADREGALRRGYAFLDEVDGPRRRRLRTVWAWFELEAIRSTPRKDEARPVVEWHAEISRRVAELAAAKIAETEKAPSLDASAKSASTLRDRWLALAGIVHRLEALAQKELRGVALDREDDAFVRNYGETLAFPMLYDGNAYSSPPADVPPTACVFTGQSADGTWRSLHAATEMPSAIYVLWPQKDREVLCRGAVMPYREFVRDVPLTDDEWRTLRGSKDAPPPPEWLAPISAPVRPEAK